MNLHIYATTKATRSFKQYGAPELWEIANSERLPGMRLAAIALLCDRARSDTEMKQMIDWLKGKQYIAPDDAYRFAIRKHICDLQSELDEAWRDYQLYIRNPIAFYGIPQEWM